MTTREPASSSCTFANVQLSNGGRLAECTIAYRTLGSLNETGDNAVLVLHGYTTGPSMLDEGANVAEGSWSGLVGPGKAIDTNRHFVVCPNMLGSSYGCDRARLDVDSCNRCPLRRRFPAHRRRRHHHDAGLAGEGPWRASPGRGGRPFLRRISGPAVGGDVSGTGQKDHRHHVQPHKTHQLGAIGWLAVAPGGPAGMEPTGIRRRGRWCLSSPNSGSRH